MITKKPSHEQLQKSLLQSFSMLKIGEHLRKGGITKGLGYSCLELFRIIFLLVFQHKNWFRLLESEKRSDLPGKDAVYRFLNHPRYNWRAFLYSLSTSMIFAPFVRSPLKIVSTCLSWMILSFLVREASHSSCLPVFTTILQGSS